MANLLCVKFYGSEKLMEYIRQSSLSKIWKLCDNMSDIDNASETRKLKFGIEMGLNAQLDEIIKLRDKLKQERELLELAEKTAREDAGLEKLWYVEVPMFCEDYIEAAKLVPVLGRPHPQLTHRKNAYQYKMSAKHTCSSCGEIGRELFKTKSEAISKLVSVYDSMKSEFDELSDMMRLIRNDTSPNE